MTSYRIYFWPSAYETGNAPTVRTCQKPGVIQPNESTREHCDKERAGELEYSPLPVRPHTLLDDIFGGITEQNYLSGMTGAPSRDGENVEDPTESQPARRVVLSPHTQGGGPDSSRGSSRR